MASFRKRYGKWQARIQRKGLPSITQSFHDYNLAQKWARKVEREIDLGIINIKPKKTLFKKCLIRYNNDILPLKTGTTFQKTKLYALTWLPIHECLDRFGNEKLEVNSRDFPSNLWKQHEPLPDIEKSKAIAKAQRENQITKDILKYVKDYQQ